MKRKVIHIAINFFRRVFQWQNILSFGVFLDTIFYGIESLKQVLHVLNTFISIDFLIIIFSISMFVL